MHLRDLLYLYLILFVHSSLLRVLLRAFYIFIDDLSVISRRSRTIVMTYLPCLRTGEILYNHCDMRRLGGLPSRLLFVLPQRGNVSLGKLLENKSDLFYGSLSRVGISSRTDYARP